MGPLEFEKVLGLYRESSWSIPSGVPYHNSYYHLLLSPPPLVLVYALLLLLLLLQRNIIINVNQIRVDCT